MFFSAFMLVLTAIQARYTGFSPKNSEEFNSASRSIKPGLIASGIVSAWTWAATLVRKPPLLSVLGNHTTLVAAIECCRIQIWYLGSVVVRRWCNSPSASLRSGTFHLCFTYASLADVSHSSLQSLNSMHPMLTHGSRLSQLAGVL